MDDFKLNGDSSLAFLGLINNLVASGKDYRVSIKEWRDKRSINQNQLMWMWLNEISNQLEQRIGQKHDAETLHEYMKLQFCPCIQVRLGTNSASIAIRSTKRLDKGEMHHYLNKIEQWAIERGFMLTIPECCEYADLREIQNR